MNPSNGGKAPAEEIKESSLKAFLAKLRKRRIIETLAAFIGGGWLIIEVVHFILIGHYHFPEKTLDITIVTLFCALACTLIWRWFSGREKPRKFKLEVVLIPLVVLIAVLLDINLLLHLKGPGSETFPVSKWKNSIAVLPFVDMSPQKDQEYFCDGMTEDLINRLSNIRELKVPARTSAFMFKGKTPDMHDVGEKLKVQTALEGSVQKSGSRMRITAQLINIADGYHLWSEKYDREVKDIFAIQDEISSAIVDALRLKLTAQEKKKIEEHQIHDTAAYELYLRAYYEIWRFKEDALDRIVQDLQNALDITGPNPLLYSAMAEAYRQYVNIGVKQEDYLEKAEDYIKKALALDPGSSKANAALGYLTEYGNQQEGILYFKKALALNPNEPDALRRLALIYLDVGKPSAALPLMERFKKADPLNPGNHLLQGFSRCYDGQFGLALDSMRKWYQSDPENPVRGFHYALMLAYNKAFDEAFSIIDRSAKATPNNAVTKFGLLLKYGLLKDKEKAFQIMTPDFQKTCQRDSEWSYYVVVAFALLDEKKKALDWLENAVNRGFINYPFISMHDTFLDNIRGEERFNKLMERVKYEWEHFEV
jgi:TolB-like protein/predicted Zn-dependent protease